jgi:hypothetical protein
MEVCKYIEFGCHQKTKSSFNLISIKIHSSKNWEKAIIYDTINEQIIYEIINNNDNINYYIHEEYNNIDNNVCLMINNKVITQPSELYLYRYIIKIIKKK